MSAPRPRQRRRMLIAGDDVWRVAGVNHSSSEPAFADVPAADRAPADVARDVRQALLDLGYGGEPVVVAVPSGWCLSATVDAAGLPRRNRRQLMLYRFEDLVPLPAEELAADFVAPAGRGAAALGVAVPAARLAPVLDALDALGVGIDSVTPLALLAAQGAAERDDAVRSADAIVWSSGAAAAAEVVLLRGGVPAAWYVVRPDAGELRRHLLPPAAPSVASRPSTPVRVALLGNEPACGADLRDVPGVEMAVGPPTEIEAAAAAFAGRSAAPPWFELRRGGLAPARPFRRVRTPAVAAAVAAVLLVAAACAGPLWRAAAYRGAAARDDAAQAALFRSVAPGRPVPAAVRSRLESERRRLYGTTGDAGGSPASLPQRDSGARLLADVLERLPADLRFRVSDLRLGDGKLYVEGQARSHADANALAEALRAGGRLAVVAPQTEQRPDRTVGFVITGARRTAAAAPTAADPSSPLPTAAAIGGAR